MAEFDIVIRGGMVYDGMGNPFAYKDVAIGDGRIREIGRRVSGRGRREIDATGLAVSPGFIDLHTHGDQAVLLYPDAENYISQGVTTVLCGNCGLSTIPLADKFREEARRYLNPPLPGAEAIPWDWDTLEEFERRVAERGTRLNLAQLVGHGSVRIAVKGFENTPVTPDEMSRMQGLLRDAMRQGAFGLSTGLIYPPGSYSTQEELSTLSSAMIEFGGIYATHLRNEDTGLLGAVNEAIEIGRANGLAVQLSHLKSSGRSSWGLVNEALREIERARGEGVDVACDVYPYSASMTTITSLLPSEAMEGGVDALLARLASPDERRRILARAREAKGLSEGFVVKDYPWESILIAQCPDEPESAGRTLDLVLACPPGEREEAFLEWLRKIRGNAMFVALASMTEPDVEAVMRAPFAAIASDGWFYSPASGGAPHPRSYGAFSRFLGRYVREKRLASMEEGIRKITSFPASRLALKNRGALVCGSDADIVVFDPDTILDEATYLSPHRFSKGIEWVLVNGAVSFERGALVGERSGRILQRGLDS